MTPVIKILPEKKLVGMRAKMSLKDNTTRELWKSFMPQRKRIANAFGTDRFSLQIYPESYFKAFNPVAEFEKWAAVEVTDFNTVPEGMATFTLPGGTYAVFYYKGNPANGPEVFRYIFMDWMPASGYTVDNRPHFEVLGERYQNGSDTSEEEIWVPVIAL